MTMFKWMCIQMGVQSDLVDELEGEEVFHALESKGRTLLGVHHSSRVFSPLSAA